MALTFTMPRHHLPTEAILADGKRQSLPGPRVFGLAPRRPSQTQFSAVMNELQVIRKRENKKSSPPTPANGLEID